MLSSLNSDDLKAEGVISKNSIQDKLKARGTRQAQKKREVLPNRKESNVNNSRPQKTSDVTQGDLPNKEQQELNERLRMIKTPDEGIMLNERQRR